AYVIYTSGTTGQPKGVMINHLNLIDYIFGLDKMANIQINSSFAMTSTITTDTGNTSLFPALVYGKALHIFSKNQLRDIQYLRDYFSNTSVDCIKIITSLWKAIDIKLPNKMLIIGGEELSVDTVNSIRKQNSDIQLFHHYGPTETTIGKLCHKVNFDKKYNKIPIGSGFSNSKMYVLTKSFSLAPVGVAGILYISGDGISEGYLNNPKLTQEKFIPNPFESNEKMYNTGDLVRWLPDGNVEYIGREDFQVKIRGFRIELTEIESCIINYSRNIKQVVVDTQTINNEKALVVYYTLHEVKEPLDMIDLKSYLQDKLPQYMVPSFFMELDKIPLVLNGKIDRRSLPQITNENLVRKNYIPPGNEIERGLVEIWQNVLDVDKIGISDNFFELGGNSMIFIKLLFEINKKFTTNFELKDVINQTDIISLAEIIKQKQDIEMDEWIIPIDLDIME
ncbi:non-ribosomal peptide synthetase, partial [Chryseobacterium sp.]|uniref:non-ribosomal peptide synthetase n=1 Tax=Chryseobacterium sp. TaxID=1871047 RepID=UPI00333EC22D